MRITRLLSLFCLLPILLSAANAEYLLDIALQQPSLAALEIPAEALINLGGRPEALRLLTNTGQTVPWLREQRHNSQIAYGLNACPSQAILVTETAEGSLEMHFLLEDKAQQPNGLSIQTSLKNFEQQVHIWGWDGESWQVLLQDGLIFESSRTLSLKNIDLQFNSGKFRKFKLQVSRATLARQAELRSVQNSWGAGGLTASSEKLQVQAQPFKIDAVRFWHKFSYESAAQPCWLYPESLDLRVLCDKQKKETAVSIKPQCYPVCGVKIICQEKNFSRLARVCQVIDGAEVDLAQERIWALDLPGQKKDSLEIRFSAVNAGELKIYFADGDNPALNYQSISTILPAYQLLFFADSDGLPYRITAQPGEKEPRYDNVEIIRQARLKSKPIAATILSWQGGTAIPLSNNVEEPSGQARLWLFVALGLCVAALTFGIIKAAQKNASDE